jgi:hypothetical protein
MRGAGIYCDSNRLGAEMCIRLKKIMKLQKGTQRWNLENSYAVRQKAEHFVEDNFLGWDIELGMWKCSGTVSIDLC